MARVVQLLVLVGALTFVSYVEANVKIAAFNVQVFGQSKMHNSGPKTVETLVKTIQRYDIILIQEIRDKSGESILELMDLVNKGSDEYAHTISERLGRSSSKEQYAYIYRENDITIVDDYQYPDSDHKFERPPFCVKVRSKHADVREFALIGIHTSPKEAFEEINALKDVHETVKEHWKTDDIMMMGDFNAGCSYVSHTKLDELDIRTSEYHWLIPDDADTTVAPTTDCPYDRFVLTGNRFWEAVVNDSAGIFHFDQEYNLTPQQAKNVSDHYPIEFSLSSSDVSAGTTVKATSILLSVAGWLSRLEL